MASSDSIQFALATLQIVNSIKNQLKAVAVGCTGQISKLNNIITNTEKKNVLLDGLAGLSVNAPGLQQEFVTLKAIVDNISANLPQITEV